ncbi:MAG: heat-shock protein Hsp70 [Nitrosomonadaceae bacterium]|nr:heat-shock protein Hsp70 [Nitrosomonadaceae bacterium]|tara:strand:+ start:3639 stop:6194 length:2556 start_codon:yes stop_codon:yes gene_type:complete
MARSKIDYGIDLGTTNSAISRMEKGEAVIKKTDTNKDTIPSCIFFNKKQAMKVGDQAYSSLKGDKLRRMLKPEEKTNNAFIEFKRTMGSDKSYFSSHMDKEYSSEELSAEILKTLKSFVTDESIQSAIVTVPAKFTSNQKDATLRAASLAGFSHCELLQEPIAAAMAYGLTSSNVDGYILVFDFGGGTFDAALLDVKEGIMKVIDTEGDNYLGGKNLDLAIVDEIIIPFMEENNSIDLFLENETKKTVLQDAMKFFAEETKIQMSFNETHNILSDLGDIPGKDDDGEEFELDITVTKEMMRETVGPIFQKSVDLTKALLERNHVDNNSLKALILVGGPTFSPVLREMLEEQIIKPDTSVDPMTVVSKGAALYAATIDVSEEVKEQQRDKTKIQLQLGYEATTVEDEEHITIKILEDKTEGEVPEKVFVEISRNDKSWSTGKVEVDKNGGLVEVKLKSNTSNMFNVLVYNEQGNLQEAEPSDITIIQGAKIGSATLPYSIGIEIMSRERGKLEFRTIKGLEKNQSTPATGVENGLKTQMQIRPGSNEDFLKVPIYQGDHGAEGTRAIHNDHVYDVIITGEHLPKLLPEGSEVNLTLKVDKSERISMSAHFPSLDDFTHDVDVPRDTTQKEIDEDWLETEIKKAIQSLELIKQEGACTDTEKLNKTERDLNNIKDEFEQGKGDSDRKMGMRDSLRKASKEVDKLQAAGEWPKIEEELKSVFYQLEEANTQFDNDKAAQFISEYKDIIPKVIKDKNIKVAQDLIDVMRQLNYAIVDEGLGAQMEVGHLNHLNDEFDMLQWSDKGKARNILDRGLQMAADNPVKEQLRPIIIELYKLLPDADKKILDGDGSELIG